jgi:hypothetical protein
LHANKHACATPVTGVGKRGAQSKKKLLIDMWQPWRGGAGWFLAVVRERRRSLWYGRPRQRAGAQFTWQKMSFIHAIHCLVRPAPTLLTRYACPHWVIQRRFGHGLSVRCRPAGGGGGNVLGVGVGVHGDVGDA